MKEYNEQVVETLDDAGCIIANKNIIIDNLQARIAELEGDVAIERASRKYWEDAYSEWINTDKAAQGLIAKDERIAELEAENARLKAECDDIKQVQFPRKLEAVAVGWKKQLAAEQLNNKLLRDALQEYIDEHEECQDADDWMAMMCSMEAHHTADEALAQPSDTFALDAYIAEKVKACRELDEKQIAYLFEERNTLTRQRDLAVYGLNEAEVYMTYCKPIEAMREIRKALLAIKDSDGK